MKKICLLIFTFLFAIVFNLAAQEEPTILLIYFEDIELVTPDEDLLYEEDLEYEMELEVGSTVLTGNFGAAELEIRYGDGSEGGTVIKLSEDTNFKIESIAWKSGANKNTFRMATGKMRAITKAVLNEGTDIYGGVSVCGVRSTDYGMHVDPSINIEDAYVLDGLIDYSKKRPDGSLHTIALGKGQMASAFGDTFAPVNIPPARLALWQETMKFDKLKEKAEKIKELRKTPEPTEEPTPEPTPEPTEEPAPTPPPEPTTEPEPTESPLPLPEDDPLMLWLKEVLGMEIGSITIGETTYSKVVMQPTFQIGKLKTALYLPIIYTKDMFNPDNWYKPKNNNEWSFGTDQEGGINIVKDVASDLFLKIKYVQWGDLRDDFFFKVGNLNNFTIGHGLIMNNYANDADFPSIRRIGVNFGVDLEKWGFELMTNDLTDVRIIGSRIYFRPFGTLAIGGSVVADINPGGSLPAEDTNYATNGIPTAEMIGNPMFFNVGLDLDQPVIESELFSMVLFADIAGLLPVFRTDATGVIYPNVTAGLHPEAMLTPDGLKNYGAMAGFFGNVWLINYNLHARFFTGTFKPAYYGPNYDRVSGEYAMNTARYISALNTDGADLSAYENTQMGIYGQAGYTMDKVFSLDFGYMWPFEFTDEGLQPATEDELHAQFILEKGIIPGIDLSGSLTYDRTNFAPMLGQKLLGLVVEEDQKPYNWIDEYTVLKGELIYGVSPNLDLAALLTGAVSRDPDDGSIIYDENDGTQKMDVTFSIETRVHF